MTQELTRKIRMIVAAPVLLTLLGGCVYTERTVEKVPGTVVVTSNPSDRIVYPEGRWQLYGDGKANPYYWVWFPAGTTPPMPPPYPSARGAVVVAAPTPADRISYAEGRWQLYGDGSATPYYWVWIPAGSGNPVYPPVPPFPQAK
jgi:hypothetical protein